MILVTGGTGVVGSRIVRGLLDNQQPVRVFARGQSNWVENPMPQLRKMGVDVVNGDVRDYQKLKKALTGCTAVIHCANIMSESKDETLSSVNVEPTKALLGMAEELGVQRFIYLSCLGASEYSSSKYLQSKWQAESCVRNSNFYWTIFRPSLIFAQESQFIRSLEFWSAKAPFVFVVGSGLNQIQPVSADDVAACVVQSLYTRETVQQTFDLVGPEPYSLTEVMEMASRYISGVDKPAFKIPAGLGYAVANILHKLNPRCPVSAEIMRVLTSEYSGDPAIMKSNFQVQMLPLESYFKPIESSSSLSTSRSPSARQRAQDDDEDEEDDDEDDDDQEEDDDGHDEPDEPRRRGSSSRRR
jgi:uncharacterized protein YbjT (DUF2867 family)